MPMTWGGILTRNSRVNEGLQKERGATRSLQEDKVGYLLVHTVVTLEEATEVLEEGDYYCTAVLEGSTHVGKEHVRYIV